LLAAFGYDADLAVQSQNAIHGVRLMMSFLPAIGCVLAIIAIALYPLGEKKVLDITAQLNKRRAANG
jgi:GPH family glycoside/pentoside/hexuronide:cation symporter